MNRAHWKIAGVLAGLLCAAPSLAEPPAIGEVTSVAGLATARQPGGAERALACGDPIYEGDLVETGSAARVGFLLGDVMTHLDAASALRVGSTPAAAPDATLEKGRVRLIDPRASGGDVRLSALETRVAGVGNDLEAYILAEKVGPYAMFCEWDAPLVADRGTEHLVLGPGECVIAKRKEPLYLARAHEQRIAAAPDELCDVDPALIAALAGAPVNHLSPSDVADVGLGPALAGAGFGLSNPAGPPMPVREACDVPGVCGFPVFVIEPVPSTLPSPGTNGPLPLP